VRAAVYESASPGFRIAAHGRAAAALEDAGAGAGARAHHVAASARPGDGQAATLLAEAGHAAAARAPAVAARWLDEALRLAPGGDPNWRLGVLAARARALVSAGHMEEDLAALVETLSLAPGEATELRVALTVACAQVETLLGRTAHASSRLRAALDALPDPHSIEAGALHLQMAVAGLWSNHRDALLDHADRGLAVATRVGDDMLAATARTFLAFGEIFSGRLDAAAELVDQAGALLDGCDDEALARRLQAPMFLGHAALIVGGALVEAGEPERATALVLELGGGEDLPHNDAPGRCIAYEVLTRAALAAGRADQAAGWARRAQASATGLGDGVFAGVARRARAAVLLAQGEPRAAAQEALEAAAGAHRSGARVEAARARLLAGRALAQAGERDNAIPQLEQARTELSYCGAKRLRDEAAHELRALGKRVTRPAGTRTSAGPALHELSPREREVAELVATGQANKQIAATLHLSVNTVQSHLKRIFAKLEVNNRAGVAAVLADRRESTRSP